MDTGVSGALREAWIRIQAEVVEAGRELAAEFGAERAMLLLELHQALLSEGEEGWVGRSRAAWERRCPWLAGRALSQALDELAEAGVIAVRGERTKTYALRYDDPRLAPLARTCVPVYACADARSGISTNITPLVGVYSDTQPPHLNCSPMEGNALKLESATSAEACIESSENALNLLSEKVERAGSLPPLGNSLPGQEDTPPGGAAPAAKTVYDQAFYAARFDAAAWERLKREAAAPEGETAATALVAAYILGMHAKYGTSMHVPSREFSRLMKSVTACLEYFTDAGGGEAVAGVNGALDYVRWFIRHEDAWMEGKRTLKNCFSSSFYADRYAAQRAARSTPDTRGRGALAFADRAGVVYEEDRMNDRTKGYVL